MTEEERMAMLLYARLPGFARKVEQAKAVIRQALEIPGAWYCAFSGGADSLCVLDLLRSMPEGKDVAVCWGCNGWDFPSTLDFLADTERRYGFHLKRYRTVESFQDWCREMGRPDLAEHYDAPEAWYNPRVWDETWLLKDTSFDGYVGVFLGLLGTRRKHGGESRARFLQLRGGAHPLYQSAVDRGTWHCSPLASWTKRDVWSYITWRNLPYNPVYDTLAALGVPLEQRRVSELTCYRTAQRGAFVNIRAGWPDLYNALCAVFPDVRMYG